MQDLSKLKFIYRVVSLYAPTLFVIVTLAFEPWLLTPEVSAEIPTPHAIESLTGQKAPDFTLIDLAGKSVSLSSQRGKVVVLVFWAPWCPPCKEELQSLNKLYQAYRSRGLVVLAVSSDKLAVFRVLLHCQEPGGLRYPLRRQAFRVQRPL